MKQALLVFIGGGFGSALRYFVSKNLNPFSQHFYLGTFAVNIIGCLLIGFLLALSAKGKLLNENQLLLLATGFCGGFTTFSTFAFEKHTLLKSGFLLHFSVYTITSVVVGIIAVALGIWLAKLI
ncbi:fluoride efflux transporter CrcB [uncultured Croceitalea sp.]|uniref:fluoride efflux transporter CrcB n=1 Tax=uncultured Croceitalea sp. TaxID=1798908 RepID=UPI0033064D0B